MKVTMPRSELAAWLCHCGTKVKESRRVSHLCTNLYLVGGGVLCIYDTGTVVMQGNPSEDFVARFNALCKSKEKSHSSHAEVTEEFDASPSIDWPDLRQNLT